MAREIVFTADDFGLSDEVNAAIVDAHRHGALHGAALMMGQPATEAAVRLAREHPGLQIGWHLHLNDGRPCTVDEWPWGRSPARAGFAIGLQSRMRALARREISFQWRAFRDTGLQCRFVNTHHHLHVHPMIRRSLVAELGSGFSGWLRWGRPRFFDRGLLSLAYELMWRLLQAPHSGRLPFATSTTLWGIDRTFTMQAGEIIAVLPSLGDGVHEFIFHPRSHDDPDTRCLIELAERI